MWAAFREFIFRDALLPIQEVVGDWGLAIIVLTVLVRLLLMPLTVKQTKSMFELQRIQPKLKAMQKKYADDKEKLQEETLKFYQEHKVNPFGGCLPTLLQMPVLFALYSVLGGTEKKPGIMMQYLADENLHGRFFQIIPDITRSPGSMFADSPTSAIPYIILVLLFGISVWLPQALMPGEKQQKMIGAYMGAMMLFFGWSAPAGVLLYWDVSSIWGIAQQQLLTAALKRGNDDGAGGKALSAADVDKGSAGSKGGKNKKKSGGNAR